MTVAVAELKEWSLCQLSGYQINEEGCVRKDILHVCCGDLHEVTIFSGISKSLKNEREQK